MKGKGISLHEQGPHPLTRGKPLCLQARNLWRRPPPPEPQKPGRPKAPRLRWRLSPIVSDIEVIGIQQINEAYDRLLKGDVKYRFVIDMASLKA
jgi:hypothetical protein